MAKEKELETARLRAKQERAADRQAEIDELRARRSPFLPACSSPDYPTFVAHWKSLHHFEGYQKVSNTLTEMQIIQTSKKEFNIK